ncbi:hypothetical protein K438DRAFT_1775498 [Mycena galopus ATCC 62051]|nr:hypothetical protein K438DRAFT_1775498 [Mycena galopus ATCC 62051]
MPISIGVRTTKKYGTVSVEPVGAKQSNSDCATTDTDYAYQSFFAQFGYSWHHLASWPEVGGRSATPATTAERCSLRLRTTPAITTASATPQIAPQTAAKCTAPIAANGSTPPVPAATGEAKVTMSDTSTTTGMGKTIDLSSHPHAYCSPHHLAPRPQAQTGMRRQRLPMPPHHGGGDHVTMFSGHSASGEEPEMQHPRRHGVALESHLLAHGEVQVTASMCTAELPTSVAATRKVESRLSKVNSNTNSTQLDLTQQVQVNSSQLKLTLEPILANKVFCGSSFICSGFPKITEM